MIIDGFTLLLFLFVVVMYGYFYFVRKSIVIPAAKHPTTKYLVAFFSLMILANAFSAGDKIEMIRSVLLRILLTIGARPLKISKRLSLFKSRTVFV